MSKGLLAFIIVAAIGLMASIVIYMKQSADGARATSDKILQEFKTVDKDLKAASLKADSAKQQLLNSIAPKQK